MSLNPTIESVLEQIGRRSAASRRTYLAGVERACLKEPTRSHLSCGNQAHAFAAMGRDKKALSSSRVPNLGIVTAYNDMLSAHQPFERFPALIKQAARTQGATAQVAGGVPAMCDGVTQGQPGMELSLFSRDVISLSAAIALSHHAFDGVVFLGVCDKIVPGLVITAATFGHLPAIFLPAGPMTSGLANDEKSRIRQEFATGEISRGELMRAEMDSYHGPGTCTFYGTANSNQMLMEFMGLHLPGTSFVNPGTKLRDALTVAGTKRVLALTSLGNEFTPVANILDERAFVNGIVGLMATGGSTNLVIHMVAMARAAGIHLELEDISQISKVVPQMAKVYPNGLADVNQFHAAGGLAFIIGELLAEGLLIQEVHTVAGPGLDQYTREPKLTGESVEWVATEGKTLNDRILRPSSNPFRIGGGVRWLTGNLGNCIMKVSAVDPKHLSVEAPARVFCDQESVKRAFRDGSLNRDVVVVVRFQGPSANGMPELHGLTPVLSVLLDRGFNVALLTDGRMSGASGKVPAAIHVSPEAATGGLIGKLNDGDMVRIDAVSGRVDVLDDDVDKRTSAPLPHEPEFGFGRELFSMFRKQVGAADQGACSVL